MPDPGYTVEAEAIGIQMYAILLSLYFVCDTVYRSIVSLSSLDWVYQEAEVKLDFVKRTGSAELNLRSTELTVSGD